MKEFVSVYEGVHCAAVIDSVGEGMYLYFEAYNLFIRVFIFSVYILRFIFS